MIDWISFLGSEVKRLIPIADIEGGVLDFEEWKEIRLQLITV